MEPNLRRDELRALAAVAFAEAGRVPATIWSVHRAVSGRVFRAVGPAAQPVAAVHDTVAATVYRGLGGAAALAGHGVDAALAVAPAAGEPLSTRPGGSLALAILNGLQGDRLRDERSPLAQPMSIRLRGQRVAATRQALAAAFPRATGRVVVFLHGLMETEFSWSAPGSPGDTYGARLDREAGTTSVFVRYNSGLHVSENGRELSALLERLVEDWPVPVSSVSLVGHSMGGLIARSACHQATEAGTPWVGYVRHIVSLGTPHLGAPLEQAVHVASAALHVVPETRPVSRFLRRRSAGIRDLRHGSLVDEDWRDRDQDALRAAACREVPLLPGATHCFVSASVTRSPRHPLGRIVGDLLVLEPSAAGRGRTRRLGFQPENGHHVGGVTHFALLHHPAVYERLRGWLAPSNQGA